MRAPAPAFANPQARPHRGVKADDIFTRVRLAHTFLARLGLPAELVLRIFDLADYNRATVVAHRSDTLHVTASGLVPNCAQLYLISPPLPGPPESDVDSDTEKLVARRVTWHVEGHDQGWTTGGTSNALIGRFHPAYSWYDACIFRPRRQPGGRKPDLESVRGLSWTYGDFDGLSKLLEPAGWDLVPNGDTNVWRVQSNRIGNSTFEPHEIVWSTEDTGDEMAIVKECGSWSGKGFVQALRQGDSVGLWMRAMFPGSGNHILGASVEIFYEVR